MNLNKTRLNLVEIKNDNAGADAAVGLYIHQDGDDACIEFAGAGGGGIKFNASAMASSDANTLDDYEEGTFELTSASQGGTLTVNTSLDQLTYTKIGRVVYINGRINFSTASSPTGQVVLSGLPFTSRAENEDDGKGIVNIAIEYTASQIDTGTFGVVADGGTGIQVRENGLVGEGESIAPHIDTGTYMYITGFYFSA